MPIALISGPANAGKAELVMDCVRRHLAHGSEPLLVVPTRADADHYRRELTGTGAALGLEVQRFRELIGEAVRRAGGEESLLGGLARERLLAALAARDGIVAPGFAPALAAFIAELQARRVTPARLGKALGRWAAEDGPGTPGRGLAELYERYQGVLARIGRVDEELRAVRALDALRREPALWGERPVLFYGFDDLTPLQLDAIETLGVVVGAEVTVSLTYEPGRTAFAGRASTVQALAPLASSHRQLGPRSAHYASGSRAALNHLERSLLEPGASRVDPGGAVRLLEGADERAELELVAEEIGALLSQGSAPREIAVVTRARGAAADLLEEVFSAAGVPFALQRRRPFADTAIGAALIGLLRCVPRREERARPNGRRLEPAADGAGEARDLLAWLRAPGLLERQELADRLEAAIRTAGTLSGERARQLWEERNWRLEAIDHLREAQQRSAGALVERAARELRWLFAAPRRGQAGLLASDELDEAAALASGLRALSELGDIARAAPELAPADAGELAHALRGVELVSGRGPAPEAVAVLDPLALRARRVRALFVCGLQEGVFPAAGAPRALLSEEERRRLAETSGLRLGGGEVALATERYLLYAAVSRPEQQLVLSWHAASDDGSPAMRSLFVDDVCDLFEESLFQRRTRRAAALDRSELGAPAPTLERTGGAIAQGIAPLRDQELLAQLRGHIWSASSLELWMGCPVRWLVERMLRAGELEPDSEPLTRGSLAHLALKQTLEGLKRQTGSARLTSARLELARELLARALQDSAADHPLSPAPERRPALRRRLRADLERYLEHAAASAGEVPEGGRGALEPTYLELEFGFAAEGNGSEGDEGDGSAGLGALELGGGVMLRGRIDRVDVGRRGEAVVYDYKGRSVSPAAKWIGERDLQVALYMRAVEELLGLRAVGGFYQPLSGGDLRARGLLDRDGGLELECVGDDARERAEVRALLEEAVAGAREAAAQAGRGELRPRPQTCAFKGGCMYPTICRCER